MLLKQQVKNLLMQLQHMYDELEDEKEIAIIKKYGYNAKYYTTLLTGKTRMFMRLYFLIYTIKMLIGKN